jgi:hypothetical protein
MAGNIYDSGLPEAQVSEESNRMRELELRIRSQLSTVVQDINSELSKIWQVLEEMQKNPPKPEVDSTAEQPAQQQAQEPQDEPPAEPDEQPEEIEQEQTNEHPRTGNHNSEDVDLEKFFYFGQK